MPILASLGAGAIGAYRQFRSGAAPIPNYIEEVFSTYLYAGTFGDSTITNGIDLSGKGGLVWIKARTQVGGTNESHALFDTARGTTKFLQSNDTVSEVTEAQSLKSFTSTGFTLGGREEVNGNAANYASWTFRKQAKFFDVVTYTGNGSSIRAISHNLGSTPGCIIVKRTDASGHNWCVYHRSLPASATYNLFLNTTDPQTIDDNLVQNNPSYSPTSTQFYVDYAAGATAGRVNFPGATYVAYLFAHDAGGFGATGTDNVISCGSVTATGGNVEVNLGYEPQWVLVKKASGTAENWRLLDNMRGISTADTPWLFPNTSGAETTGNSNWNNLTSTGFNLLGWGSAGNTYIYIAIRRGPMKTPTSGTNVFNTILRDGTSSTQISYTGLGFSPDIIWGKVRGNALARPVISSRLTGTLRAVYTDLTNAESGIDAYNSFDMDGFTSGSGTTLNSGPAASGYYYVHHCFKRAPGFFDVVCYTGTGSNDNKNHNLGVIPELVILKARSSAIAWYVMGDDVLGGAGRYLSLNTTAAYGTGATHQTWASTTFSVGSLSDFNGSGTTYIAYLFATLTGVSKVGSYTGTGTTLQVNCGFTAGARYVLIKRTDDTGNWYVWDSTRGIVSGNDPYLLLNSLAAEVTNTDYIDTYSSGFEISSTAPAEINANGGTYIFLAIA